MKSQSFFRCVHRMLNINDNIQNDLLASRRIQLFLASFSSLFSEANDPKTDHPEFQPVRNDFETYKEILQYPPFQRDAAALIDFINKGLKIFPEQRDLYLSISEILCRAGNHQLAVGYINHALTLSPTLDVLLKRAEIEIAAGLLAAAEATLHSLLAIDTSCETTTMLAQIKLLQGDRTAALALLDMDAPVLSARSRVVQSRILFENTLFSRARQVLEGGESDVEAERLRKIEQLFLAPLSKEFYAYARRPNADRGLVALLLNCFAENATNAVSSDDLLGRSEALSAAGDIDGALLCDRLLLARHTGLGDVEADRRRIANKLDTLGKIRRVPSVPIQTIRTRILVVMATSNLLDPSAQHNKITGSLRYCDFVEPTFFYLKDEIEQSSIAAANRKLIDYCRLLQPELIVTSIHYDLLSETLAELKKMGIPIVLDCHDILIDRLNYAEKNLQNVSVGIANGFYDFYQSLVSQPEKLLSSPGISYHPNLLIPIEKDIPVSFIGTANAIFSPVRRQALDFLKTRGIEVLHLGGYAGGKLLTDEEYCTYVARSKIVLNFSETFVDANSFSYSCLKNRSLEALTAGALVVESYNKDTPRWFTPGQHYDTFSSHDELEMKLRMYLDDEQLRQSIADAGHALFMDKYHPFRLWSAIIATALANA